jgi:hypothetical protein
MSVRGFGKTNENNFVYQNPRVQRHFVERHFADRRFVDPATWPTDIWSTEYLADNLPLRFFYAMAVIALSWCVLKNKNLFFAFLNSPSIEQFLQ